MERTRHELNHMMMEINRNAERNVTLIEDRINKLKETEAETENRIRQILSDADRHIEILKGELKEVENSKIFQSRLMEIGSTKPVGTRKTPAARTSSENVESIVEKSTIMEEVQVVPKKTRTGTRKTPAKATISLEENEKIQTPAKVESYRPRGPVESYRYEQKNLFEEGDGKNIGKEFSQEIDEIVRNSSFQIENTEGDMEQGGSSPKVGREAGAGPEIIMSKNPVKPKESKKAQVLRLASTGLDADEISQQLRMSVTEVEFILAME